VTTWWVDATLTAVPDLLGRLAHGVGTRKDLPLPFAAALVAAVVALVASFVALGALWRKPRLTGSAAGRPIGAAWSGVVDASWLRWVLRLIGLVLTGYFLLGLLIGPDDALNPSAGVVYVLLWVGTLVVASALLGPVWRLINPLRTVHLIGCRLLLRAPTKGFLPPPTGLGLWPGALAILSFGWLELVAPDRATTHVLTLYLAGYTVWVLGGAVLFGDRWIRQGDGFEIISDLYGRLSVLGRRADRELVLRSPLNGIAGLRKVAGTAAVVCVLLGTTAYDGLSSAPWWATWVQEAALPARVAATGGLLGVVAVVGVTYLGATALSGRLSGTPELAARMPRELAHTVVPIALGYAVAHYYSLLVIVGQQTVARLSDPLGTGANWLGTADGGISYTLVGATTVATVQIVAVVVGHIVGVVLAHDRTVALVPPARAVVAQLPVLGLMVFFTLAGLTLLFSA
jgi:hypothetical protein